MEAKLNKILSSFGLAVDMRLKPELSTMDQETLKKLIKMNPLKEGSASTGLVLNSLCMFFGPAFMIGTALRMRQRTIAKRTQEMILQALRAKDPSVTSRVKGQRRYFMSGVGMKAVFFAGFVGHIQAEDFIIQLFTPSAEHVVAGLSHGPVQDALHHAVNEFFQAPHAFNDNAVVHVLQEIGGAPQHMVMEHLGVHPFEAASGCLDMGGVVPWPSIGDCSDLASQIAIGAAMEVNVPAEVGQMVIEEVASQDWRRRRHD